mgnify:CR=1 FL=1
MDNLNATKDSFVDVSDGIAVSRQETSVIESNADSCNEARKQIDDVVTNCQQYHSKMQLLHSRQQHLWKNFQQLSVRLQIQLMTL